MSQALLNRTPRQLRARSEIEELEKAMREGIEKGELVQTQHDGTTEEGDREVQHFFAEGVYGRALVIRAGQTVIGRVHHQDRLVIICAGECMFIDEDHRRRVQAPYIETFKAGCKTAVYAITDILWIAVIATELTDPIKILKTLSSANHDEFTRRMGGKT